jgi:hypothetical protein
MSGLDKDTALRLHEDGAISVKTLLEWFDVKWEDEVKRLEEEREAKSAARKEEDALYNPKRNIREKMDVGCSRIEQARRNFEALVKAYSVFEGEANTSEKVKKAAMDQVEIMNQVKDL